MTALLLVLFQIILLCLKSYISKNTDREIENKKVLDEQDKLDHLAKTKEEELRFTHEDPLLMDQFQDAITEDLSDGQYSHPRIP